MARRKDETNIEIPGDWENRDRALFALAQQTGFRSVNKLVGFVAYEVSHCRTASEFYRALSAFHDAAHGVRPAPSKPALPDPAPVKPEKSTRPRPLTVTT